MKKKKVYVAPRTTIYPVIWESSLLYGSFNGGHAVGSDEETLGEWHGGHEGGGGAGEGEVAPDEGD